MGSMLCLSFIASVLSTTDTKVWSQCEQTNEECKCGDTLQGAIFCSDDSLQIQPCYCMFYDKTENVTIAGTCMSNCLKHGPLYYKNITRYSVQNATKFNSDMCSLTMTLIDTHREGRFCAKCERDYGLAVYSYHYLSCIPCKDYSYKNWLRYFAVALLFSISLWFC